MPNQITDADRDLLGELGIDTAPAESKKNSPPEKNGLLQALKRSNALSKNREDCPSMARTAISSSGSMQCG